MPLDEDGNVYEKGWDGQQRQQQGWLGPKQDKDVWGNPKIEKDVWSDPVPERDWLGTQRTSASGKPLFRTAGAGLSGLNFGQWDGLIKLFLLLLFGVFWLAYLWIRACFRYPKVMLPITGVVIAVVIVFSATSGSQTASTGYATGTQISSQSAPQTGAQTTGQGAPAADNQSSGAASPSTTTLLVS